MYSLAIAFCFMFSILACICVLAALVGKQIRRIDRVETRLSEIESTSNGAGNST